ncbi:hypothetical protein CLAVI_000262 [Candidatus Clavichlamydia salmonicola]|uniref:hypothetical protein n=1 Tax=Candidatus Clavichlamydia salmonicola TaxID=469812 RepID=UPI001891622C|nr:hypothetical protein [Candidatus Clavichlamydia salmonicola]MBF5050648.1 hypothetical protein [Candidatus Clavichlamydia salmonicola]
MINCINNNVLGCVGVRFPETPREAYENVKWKLSTLNRIFQVGISGGMGMLEFIIEKMDSCIENSALTPSLTIPNLNSTEDATADIVLSTITSLTTSAESYTTGTSATSPSLSTVLSMIMGNETNTTGTSMTSPLLSTVLSMITGNEMNNTISLISPRENGLLQAGKNDSGLKPYYCDPMAAIAAMLSLALFVWTAVKIVRRCQGSGEGGQTAQLVTVGDILLLGASGLGFVGDSLSAMCYPCSDSSQGFTDLSSMLGLSAILYLTHAGVLVLSAVCADRSVTILEREGLEEDICLSQITSNEGVV